jgi:ethanolamine kinase
MQGIVDLQQHHIDMKKVKIITEEIAKLCKLAFPNESNEFQIVQLHGGTTNQLYKVKLVAQDKIVLVRIYGHRTSDLIDRDAENYYLITIFATYPDKVPDIYCKFGNGLIYEYIEGRALTSDELPVHYKATARALAGWHHVEVEPFDKKLGKEPRLFKTLHKWLKQAQTFEDVELVLPLTLDEIQHEVEEIESLVKDRYPVCFCHNDLTYGNLVYNDSTGTVRFIDYEYCGYNYRGFDIGNHWCEYTGLNPMDVSKFPSKEHRLAFCREYLISSKQIDQKSENVTVTDQEVHELFVEATLFVLMSNLLWTVWGLVQGKNSLLSLSWSGTSESWYQGYTKTRLNWYLATKQETLELLKL